MSNILLLPQMQATFHIVRNADWIDHIDFKVPGGVNPLDISNIDFYAQIRVAEDDPLILVDLSMENGKLINGAQSGILRTVVRHEELLAIELFKSLQTAVMDILAVADGYRINLFQEAGAAQVLIHPGVTLVP